VAHSRPAVNDDGQRPACAAVGVLCRGFDGGHVRSAHIGYVSPAQGPDGWWILSAKRSHQIARHSSARSTTVDQTGIEDTAMLPDGVGYVLIHGIWTSTRHHKPKPPWHWRLHGFGRHMARRDSIIIDLRYNPDGSVQLIALACQPFRSRGCVRKTTRDGSGQSNAVHSHAAAV
jgi:hypothetical protein